MSKPDKGIDINKTDFKYTIGSNVISVNDTTKYLSVVIWDEVTYDEIKKYIVG